MAERTFKPRQLVDSNLVTEFGGVEDLEQFKEEGAGHHDYTYVPGFSDMRKKRDLDLAAVFRGEIKGRDVQPLGWNCRWFKTVKGAGSEPDNSRVVHAKNQGYRVVTKADLGQPWLTELPPNAIQAPDGTIRMSGGDQTLFVATQEVAARNAMRKKIKTEQSVDGMEFQSGGLGTVKIPGSEPYVEKTIGREAIK